MESEEVAIVDRERGKRNDHAVPCIYTYSAI